MTKFASGQQSIAAQPNQAYPGDYYGIPGLAGSSSAATGFVGESDIFVGKFAWVVDGLSAPYTNTRVTFLKGSNTIPVFIPRENANTYSNADLNQGWSMTIPLGYQLEGCKNGSFYCEVTSLNDGGTISAGDVVYVNDTTGDVAVSTDAPVSGYTATSYTVINPAVPNTFGVNLVVISNNGGI